jgi:hypothetical protein
MFLMNITEHPEDRFDAATVLQRAPVCALTRGTGSVLAAQLVAGDVTAGSTRVRP